MPARTFEGPFSMHSLDYGFEVGKLKLRLRSSTKEPCPGSTGGLHSHNACIHAHRSGGRVRKRQREGNTDGGSCNEGKGC